jgi:hypothetical protein
MTTPNRTPYDQIDAVLRTVGRQLPRLPDWWPEFLDLTADSPDEERLAVYQAVRDDGTFEEQEGSFLVCYTIDQMITRRGSVEALPIDERTDQITELYKLLDPHRRPCDESDPLEGQPLGIWRARFLEQLEAHGEIELLDLYRRAPINMSSDMKFGQIPFFGSPPEGVELLRACVQSLYDEVSECVSSDWPMGPLRRRWDFRAAPILTVTISPTPIELVGGPRDGKLVDPALSRVDLIKLYSIFDEVSDFYWSVEDEERQNQSLCLWGAYQGLPHVMFTLYAGALDGDRPTLKERDTPLPGSSAAEDPEDDE